MVALAGSSLVATTTATGYSFSLSEIHWLSLTQSAQWTVRRIAFPISIGYSEAEIATYHQESVAWVKARMMLLRREIEAQ